MKISFLSLITLVAAGHSAFAATPGLQDAYSSQQQIVGQLQNGDIEVPAQRALNVLVAHGVSVLAQNGNTELANQFAQEWKSQFDNYLPTQVSMGSAGSDDNGGVMNILDLGDHDPLSPWLANFNDTLKAKTMGISAGVQIISDINTMNYALAVVLHPRSKSWKSGTSYQDDEWEYRKHFIPMANIITYWVTLESCDFAATKLPMIKPICPTASNKLEFYMGRYWAPKLSDKVYEKANGMPPAQDTSVRAMDLAGTQPDEATFEQEVLNINL